ncbi:MAG: ribose 5-phosphate isomerase B [Chloroflexi bacterium]|nr:ribose 5-phosphate isomerase B [Chloroflexota bacterium]
MKVAIGSDHAGYMLKDHLANYLRSKGYEVTDVGTDDPKRSVDYPDFAQAVSQRVLDGSVERGIIVCGSGVGACIAANKISGIYAALCHDIYSAHQGVEHDNMNVICLGSRVVGAALAEELAEAFLSARFEADQERHVRRHNKVRAIEQSSTASKA